ncbi:MAG: hypothetical protein ABJG41_02030 [Cyclobacteriaceae bacterium]
MHLIDRLSSTQGLRTQDANKALAKDILISQDFEAIHELKSLLTSPPDQKVLFDVLKTLETIGESNPKMIEHLFEDLSSLLNHKKNMVVWIAMSALSHITMFHPQRTFELLGNILQVMDGGSVITRDKGMVMLVGLYNETAYRQDVKPLIVEQILMAPDNQFGQYVEKWMKVILPEDVPVLIDTLEQRLPELTSPSHQKRAHKNLKKLLNSLK